MPLCSMSLTQIMVEKVLDVVTEIGLLYFMVRILKFVYLMVYMMSMLTCLLKIIVYHIHQ